MLDEKYNQENYLVYNEEVGIYDKLSSPIVEKIKELSFEYSVPSDNVEFDELALRYLKTEQLWWVLAIYNDVSDVMNPEKFPPIIYIPNRLDVELLLSSYRLQD